MHRIRLTEDAEQNLIDILRCIALHDIPENADYILNQLESFRTRLADLPE